MKVRIVPAHDGLRVEFWYDPHTRCWWARVIDAANNQVGNAIDAYTKREILKVVADLTQPAKERQ